MDINNVSNHKLNIINNKDLKTDNQKKDSSFSNVLQKSLQDVNKLQHQANQASKDLALGKTDNIHNVMIAAQKAKLSLSLTTSVRNKVVDAYKEIMRIQV
ncbi:flagellar hook-basal body complex protein FliE [Halobacteroides halobius DSM 5150]|uniref:Flagellar hook-basal body complex protein FliE n=1 Tax=Halobacteroides halobius (strain ATCC 35273 / DSM 5150 / MD-1) TaxID=748449 RepID=L0K8D0_HALHC|nr:flagellar hook-basal body complex protein FliE [Halobacteroides halobius]AGB40624.1 flagellar hook-basal body complex protein FliE [Halobacteroides halobius DSM 5150]